MGGNSSYEQCEYYDYDNISEFMKVHKPYHIANYDANYDDVIRAFIKGYMCVSHSERITNIAHHKFSATINYITKITIISDIKCHIKYDIYAGTAHINGSIDVFGPTRIPFIGFLHPIPMKNLAFLSCNIYFSEPVSFEVEYTYFAKFDYSRNFIVTYGDLSFAVTHEMWRCKNRQLERIKQTRAKNAIRRQLPTMLRRLYRPNGPMLQRFIKADYDQQLNITGQYIMEAIWLPREYRDKLRYNATHNSDGSYTMNGLNFYLDADGGYIANIESYGLLNMISKHADYYLMSNDLLPHIEIIFNVIAADDNLKSAEREYQESKYVNILFSKLGNDPRHARLIQDSFDRVKDARAAYKKIRLQVINKYGYTDSITANICNWFHYNWVYYFTK